MVVLATMFAGYGQEQLPPSKPLAMSDIARLRHQRVSAKSIVNKATEQGVDFKVTPGIQKQLARLGFDADQIDAIRQASAPREKPAGGAADNGPPIVAGEGLPGSEEQRKGVYERIAKIAKLSGVGLQPVAARHVTVWAAKDDRATVLPDIKKIENYLEGKCQEPLRSGLDKRSAHLVLLKTRYEYEKWVNAMYEVMPEAFKLRETPGGKADMKAAILKWSGFYTRNMAVLCAEGQEDERLRRLAVADLGYMNFVQQVDPGRHDPLATGFANGIESLLFGQPSVLLFSNSYHDENRDLGNETRDWLHLVQDRIRRRKATTVRALLMMDTTNMLLPHYAEVWTLTGVLTKQPEKYGKLILALREEKDALKAIEQVYGWDDKKLEEEWHKWVLAQR
jgi:hypothetical protein